MAPANQASTLSSAGSPSAGLDELLQAIALGDQGAFDNLYRIAAPKLFGICLRVLPQRAEAEEVLQDVFLTVWRKADQFDSARASAYTWLAMMARNRAIDRLRSAKVERVGKEVIDPDEDTDAPPAHVDAESAQDRERLETCMGELEDQRRSMIRTAFFEGATYEELATRTNTPIGTVKSWIRRGLLQLKACLQR